MIDWGHLLKVDIFIAAIKRDSILNKDAVSEVTSTSVLLMLTSRVGHFAMEIVFS